MTAVPARSQRLTGTLNQLKTISRKAGGTGAMPSGSIHRSLPKKETGVAPSPHLIAAQARMADAERFGIEQHDGEPRRLLAAIDPGMIGAALDHDIASAQFYGGLIHVHLDLARQHDDVVDRLGAMHFRLDTRREFHDDEARAVLRRRGAENARAHVLDVAADGNIRRHHVAAPHQRRSNAFARPLGVGRRTFEDDFGDVVAVVTGNDATDRLAGHEYSPDFCFKRYAGAPGARLRSMNSMTLPSGSRI